MKLPAFPLVAAFCLLAREAVEWLEKDSRQPFFLYLAFTSPHVPLSESENWMGLYRNWSGSSVPNWKPRRPETTMPSKLMVCDMPSPVSPPAGPPWC